MQQSGRETIQGKRKAYLKVLSKHKSQLKNQKAGYCG